MEKGLFWMLESLKSKKSPFLWFLEFENKRIDLRTQEDSKAGFGIFFFGTFLEFKNLRVDLGTPQKSNKSSFSNYSLWKKMILFFYFGIREFKGWFKDSSKSRNQEIKKKRSTQGEKLPMTPPNKYCII